MISSHNEHSLNGSSVVQKRRLEVTSKSQGKLLPVSSYKKSKIKLSMAQRKCFHFKQEESEPGKERQDQSRAENQQGNHQVLLLYVWHEGHVVSGFDPERDCTPCL